MAEGDNAFRNGFRSERFRGTCRIVARSGPSPTCKTSSLSCPTHRFHDAAIQIPCPPSNIQLSSAPMQPPPMASCSRSLSFKFIITNTRSAVTSPAYPSTTTILQDEQLAIKLETERGEARFEFYGGNDPEDPPAKNDSFASPLPLLPKSSLTSTRTLLPGMVPKTLKTRKTGRYGTGGVSPQLAP